jgi:hypothetical protein
VEIGRERRAAASEAGGLGVVQPISLIYVHGHEFRAGLRYIRSLTAKPIGFNALIEASNKAYLDRMRQWIDVALEEGVRFFITSLGNPQWVCERVHSLGAVVYHDVTERKWAQNRRERKCRRPRWGSVARSAVRGARVFRHTDSERRRRWHTGGVCASTAPGLLGRAAWFARWMLRGRKTKHWMRTWYALNSVRRLKRSLLADDATTEYWQAGKSVAGIDEIKPAGEIVKEFAAELD